MLPVEIADCLRPKEGHIIVERCDMPERRGLIWLPSQSVEARLSAEAIVVRSSSGRFVAGERVLLAPTVSRRITLGANGSRVLWVASEHQVVCRVTEDAPRIFQQPVDTFANYRSDEDLQGIKDSDPRWQEGEPAPFQQG